MGLGQLCVSDALLREALGLPTDAKIVDASVDDNQCVYLIVDHADIPETTETRRGITTVVPMMRRQPSVTMLSWNPVETLPTMDDDRA
jgi:hypothetical protein